MVIGDVAAFSTARATATPAVTSILSDPSLLGDGITAGDATFDVVDPGASAKQFEEGSAVIAQVRRWVERTRGRQLTERVLHWAVGRERLHCIGRESYPNLVHSSRRILKTLQK